MSDAMNPLSPNTAAFLSYLTTAIGESDNAGQPAQSTFFAPSALLPISGQPASGGTSPSQDTSQSPPDSKQFIVSESDDGDPPREFIRKASTGTLHKRKAGQGHVMPPDEDEDEEDDDESSVPSGHEDKRQHPNTNTGTRTKGVSKSNTKNEDGRKGSKDQGKAAKRKEQNRAAQKAFRERREGKVRDLEEKVAELEAQSYGTSAENENLRGILKRLQEENVKLRQSAFTFSMPVAGNTPPATNQNTPLSRNPKLPSPPQHGSDDQLRTISDLSFVQHRASADSLDSLVSFPSANRTSSTDSVLRSTPSHPRLFEAEAFNAFASGGFVLKPRDGPSPSTFGSSNNGLSPLSTASTNKTEVDALWANFYPSSDIVQQNQAALEQPKQQVSTAMPAIPAMPALPAQPQSPFSAMFGNPFGSSGFSNGISSNKMAFRDNAGYRDLQSGLGSVPQSPGGQPDWGDLNSSSVDEFLASLAGPQNADSGVNNADDDYFDNQLKQILAYSGSSTSPSAAFALPDNNIFSPTNYLNMASPDSGIDSRSPHSQRNDSNSVSPESTGPSSVDSAGDGQGSSCGSYGAPKIRSGLVLVVDDSGRVIQPSEMWTKMGMQHEANLDAILIDDLCDQLRAKATCKDGQHFLSVEDAQHVFRNKAVRPEVPGMALGQQQNGATALMR